MDINDLVQLVKAAQNGNREAFGVLYQHYAPRLEKVARQFTEPSAQAWDLIQKTFIQVIKKIRQLREPSRFPGWLKSILCRLGTNQVNRCKKHGQSTDPRILNTRPDSLRPDIESTLRVRESREKVRAILNTLPQPDRDVLVMHYFLNLSIKDISGTWNIPEGTVKRRLFDARNRLRERLEEDGCCGPDLAF